MAVIDNCPVTLAGEGHVLDVLFSAVWCAEGADHPCRIIEVCIRYERFDHLMAPVEVRLNERLADAGFAFRLLRAVVPPLLRGVM